MLWAVIVVVLIDNCVSVRRRAWLFLITVQRLLILSLTWITCQVFLVQCSCSFSVSTMLISLWPSLIYILESRPSMRTRLRDRFSHRCVPLLWTKHSLNSMGTWNLSGRVATVGPCEWRIPSGDRWFGRCKAELLTTAAIRLTPRHFHTGRLFLQIGYCNMRRYRLNATHSTL